MQIPSTTNWVVPERADLLMALSAGVIAKADGNVTPDAQPDDPTSPPLGPTPIRSQVLVDQMVRKVRAAIRNAGHTPLSVLANTVPPEAFDHVIYMAAWRLVNSTPNIQMVVVTEKGVYAPLADMNKKAEEWTEGRIEGGRRVGGVATYAVTPPTDPTGRDWLSAVCVPTRDTLATFDWTTYNPPIKGQVREGSLEHPIDLRIGAPQWWPDSVREHLGTP